MLYSLELPYGASRATAADFCSQKGLRSHFEFSKRWPIPGDLFTFVHDDSIVFSFVEEQLNEVGEVFFILDCSLDLSRYVRAGILSFLEPEEV